MKYFVWVNDEQQGPFDEETIQVLVSDKQLTTESMVCPENGGVDWKQAGEVFPRQFFDEAIVAYKPSVEFTDLDNPADQPDDGSRLKIRMNSGAELSIKAVRLYDEIGLNKLNVKKAEAAKMFQGVSTGLGAIGSIEWVLATSIVIGATEAILSAGTVTIGKRLLEEALYLDTRLREEGVFIPIVSIKQIETPILGRWQAPYTKKWAYMAANNKREIKTVQAAYVHNGDDFISVQTDDGSFCSIRWNAVESCAVCKPA